jgi:haloacetate dehalogenase
MERRRFLGGQWAPNAHGQAMKGGHFFPEENAGDTAVLVKQFLAA